MIHSLPYDGTSLSTSDGKGRVTVADLPLDLDWDDHPVVVAAREYDVPVEVYRRSSRGPDDALADPVTGETHRRRPDWRGTTYLFEG
jgi:hypothetical protein